VLFGYARVSTQQQSVDRQIDALLSHGISSENIFQEKISGTKANRPELDLLMKILRAEDTLVIESLSRLGRSTKDLLTLLDKLQEKRVNLVSLKENLDMNTPTGMLLVTVLSAISQFEREIIIQRTEEGLIAARSRGRSGGRPRKDPRIIDKAMKLYNAKTHSIKEICEITGISQGTLYNTLNKCK